LRAVRFDFLRSSLLSFFVFAMSAFLVQYFVSEQICNSRPKNRQPLLPQNGLKRSLDAQHSTSSLHHT
jgi:hypothetical protein